MNVRAPLLAALALAPLACVSPALEADAVTPLGPLERVDELIQPGEEHFAGLWRVATGGENAEGYWSFAGDRLSLQRTDAEHGCDRIFVTDPKGGPLIPVSDGRGVTTCAYFLPGDREVVFGSTQGSMQDCPPPVDRSDGYVWPIHAEYDLWVRDLASGAQRRLGDAWGYDAEATISPLGDRMVFTSTRSGDLELWTCDLDGGNARQVTDELGYDGGAFFSHDGSKLVFRATRFVEDADAVNGVGTRAQYKDLLAKHKIRPHRLDLYVCNVDGSGRRRVTDLGGASWAPYFFPGDERIVFSSNHHDRNVPQVEFDLFAIDADGSDLERITTYAGFDSFPMFSPDGEWLVFASNRGGSVQGETNLYLARWK
jgi:dipeptidyl aminopeptidase/acylaminoacyl peptidase